MRWERRVRIQLDVALAKAVVAVMLWVLGVVP